MTFGLLRGRNANGGERGMRQVTFSRAIRKAFCRRLYRTFGALRCFAANFAHKMALRSCRHTGRFSCKPEICPYDGMAELVM